MAAKTPRAVKPRPLGKRLTGALEAVANGTESWNTMRVRRADARAILSALEYERERAEKAETERAVAERRVLTGPTLRPLLTLEECEAAGIIPKRRTK
jgi:hypothetical protein